MPTEWSSRFSAYVIDTMNLIRLTYEGVSRVNRMPNLLEVLGSVEISIGEAEKEVEKRKNADALANARKVAALAQAEIDTDFALLHAHALMGLWGALEAMVEDLAVEWIATGPGVMGREIFKKVKVNVATWESLTTEERQRHLVAEIQRECKADLSMGVGQFEGFLDAVGLGGGVHKALRDDLFIAQQIRHLIAHRASRADARFVRACPMLGYEIGDPVRMSGKRFFKLVTAMTLYSRLLANRLKVLRGEEQTTDGILPEDIEKIVVSGAA